jgi:outer membrane protein assembly factor BamB
VRRYLSFAALLALLGAAVRAEDWPQFRGPTGQGHSSERGLPLDWSESRNVKWKTPVPGRGWSSPVVAGGRVWLTTSVKANGASLRAVAYDVETGREAVNVEVFHLRSADLLNAKNSHASPTPIADGDRVFVHFGAEGTAALTTSGEIVWKTRLPYQSQHGNGGSPMLYGDLLILSCDGSDQAFVVALDKRTGKVRWKTWRRQPWDQAYTTPLLIRVGDQDQVVSVGAYRAAAYDPQTGKELWRVSYADGFSNVPRPVYGHGLVYIATGFQQPTLLAVRPDGSGDVTKTHVAWTLRRAAPLTPSPLIVGDEIYVVNDGGIASCLDAKTGDSLWQQRLGGEYSASPVFADGRIYFLNEEGTATTIAPGKVFVRLATASIDGATLASIAVADGSFFIRSDTHLYRIAKAS